MKLRILFAALLAVVMSTIGAASASPAQAAAYGKTYNGTKESIYVKNSYGQWTSVAPTRLGQGPQFQLPYGQCAVGYVGPEYGTKTWVNYYGGVVYNVASGYYYGLYERNC